jgi:hypothetical protein
MGISHHVKQLKQFQNLSTFTRINVPQNRNAVCIKVIELASHCNRIMVNVLHVRIKNSIVFYTLLHRELFGFYIHYPAWPGWCSQYSDSLRTKRLGDRIPVEARLFAPVQTGPGAHPASCTTANRSFSRV